MGTRLPWQERAQSLSIPVMSIQIHKNDWPGASLQERGKHTSQIKHYNGHLYTSWWVEFNSVCYRWSWAFLDNTRFIQKLHIRSVKASPAQGLLKSNLSSFPQNHILLWCSIYKKNKSDFSDYFGLVVCHTATVPHHFLKKPCNHQPYHPQMRFTV